MQLRRLTMRSKDSDFNFQREREAETAMAKGQSSLFDEENEELQDLMERSEEDANEGAANVRRPRKRSAAVLLSDDDESDDDSFEEQLEATSDGEMEIDECPDCLVCDRCGMEDSRDAMEQLNKELMCPACATAERNERAQHRAAARAAAKDEDNDWSSDGGDSDFEEDEIEHEWADEGRPGVVQCDSEGQGREVNVHDSLLFVTQKKTIRARAAKRDTSGMITSTEHVVCRTEDGDEVVEVVSFFDDEVTGEMQLEGYVCYDAKQLAKHAPYFKMAEHATQGFKRGTELVYSKHPVVYPANAVIEKVRVKDNVSTLSEGLPAGSKYRRFFYRYQINELEERVVPAQALRM